MTLTKRNRRAHADWLAMTTQAEMIRQLVANTRLPGQQGESFKIDLEDCFEIVRREARAPLIQILKDLLWFRRRSVKGSARLNIIERYIVTQDKPEGAIISPGDILFAIEQAARREIKR